jgi:molecular chaperone DnaJ
MAKNYYDILGVTKSSSPDEIKRAFRKKAHEYHPDKAAGNADKFKEVNEAYQVLSDTEKRQQYDTYGQTFDQAQRNGSGFGGNGNPFEGFSTGGGRASGWDFSGGFGQGGVDFDLGDIFSDFFGGRQEATSRRNKGIDLEMAVTISFEEAVFGVEKTLNLEKQDVCKTCKGSGAEAGTKINTCPKCHGQGQIRTTRQTIFGAVASAVACDRCEGTGQVPEKPCKTCGGRGILRQDKTIMVKIPAGIDNGQRIRVAGEGEAGYRGSSSGDLYLLVKVKPHKDFLRDGFNLYKDLPISFTQAALGAKIITKTLDGDIEVKIPNGTQSGTVLKIKDKGVPHINSKSRGDLMLTVRVVVPQKLSKKEKSLLKDLAEERGETVEVDDSLWQSLKDNF